MHFARTISVKHHSTGDHYSVSIPRPVAEALNLYEDGGLVSIELAYKSYNHKKGANAQAVLKSYRNSDFAWTEKFDPTRTGSDLFKPVVIPPRTLGVSRPWGCGKVFDRSIIRELRAARLWITAEFRKVHPSRRGRKAKRRRSRMVY
jgi:hypothetical protein